VLEVGVDDGDKTAGGGESPLDDGRSEAAATDAADAADARIVGADATKLASRAIRAVVVDENRLPAISSSANASRTQSAATFSRSL